MGRKLPSTSLAANLAAVPEMRAEHHGKIISALKELGQANYEVVAVKCLLERHQVGRRMKELEVMGIVFKPGSKTPTKSGRNAYDYCLTSEHTKKTDQPVTYKAGIKNSSDYSKELINSTKQLTLL